VSRNRGFARVLAEAAVLRYKFLSFQGYLTFADAFSVQVQTSTCKSLPSYSV
jgi:hypothetical protein